MRRCMSIGQIVAVVILLATGCAEQSSQAGSTPAQDGAVASANGSKLAGTWRGAFEQVQTGDSGRIHGDIECQVKDNGTYQMTWTTRLVAGSTRGGRVVMSGTVVEKAGLVEFNEGRSGTRTTLSRSGDTLYGVRIDPATKRVSVSVDLHRVGIIESP